MSRGDRQEPIFAASAGRKNGEHFIQSGMVAVIGEEPLLAATRTSSNTVRLVLYSIPGSTNVIQTTTNMTLPEPWSVWQIINPTNLWQGVPVVETNRNLFFRAIRE